VTRLEENPAHMPRDRIKRTNAKILKELGIMDGGDDAAVEVNVHEELLDGMKAAHDE